MATLPRLRPQHFYDLIVEVALIRPGADRRCICRLARLRAMGMIGGDGVEDFDAGLPWNAMKR